MAKKNNEKTRKVYICSLYLSKFDKDAIRELGYKNKGDAYKRIGEILDYNHNSIKNYRDKFDAFYDNERKGWGLENITGSIRKIFEEFNDYDFESISQIVKDILEIQYHELFIRNRVKLNNLTLEKNKYLKQEEKKEKQRLQKERNLEEQRCVLILNQEEGGIREVPIFDFESIVLVGLADLVTNKEIIEVKNINNWKHGLGQIFAYWYYSLADKTPIDKQLQPRIHLFGGNGIDDPRIELCKSSMRQIFNPYTNFIKVTYRNPL